MGRRHRHHVSGPLRLQLSSTAAPNRDHRRPAPAGLWWEVVGQAPEGGIRSGGSTIVGSVDPDALWDDAERTTVALAWAGLAVLTARPSTPDVQQTIMSGPYVATLALRRPALIRTLIAPELRPPVRITAHVTVYANSLCLLTIKRAGDERAEGDRQTEELDESLRRFVEATNRPIGPVTSTIDLDPVAPRT